MFRILFVGSVSVRKGIGYLLEAVRPLVRRRRVELWLVGAVSPDAAPLLARNADLFEHRGFVAPERLAQTYSQGSVLVLPSVEEGLARVQAQAMACGVPVIATPNTGSEDLFTDGVEGFIVPARDARAIRDRIEWLLDHPAERERMGFAARSGSSLAAAGRPTGAPSSECIWRSWHPHENPLRRADHGTAQQRASALSRLGHRVRRVVESPGLVPA